MNNVRVTPTDFTGWKIEALWPVGVGIRVTLHLTDPDQQVQTDVFEWMATEETTVDVVATTLAAQIESLPHWRARPVSGGQMRIGTASDDYSGESLLEII
jgi:hypothetical protein